MTDSLPLNTSSLNTSSLNAGAAQVAVRTATIADVPAISVIQSESMVETVLLVAGEDRRGVLTTRLAPDLLAPTWQNTISAQNSAQNSVQSSTEGEGGTPRGVLVARDQDVVVGFAAFVTPVDPQAEGAAQVPDNLPFEVPIASAQIIAFDVAAQAQGQGHGSRLLSAIADTAGAAGSPGLLVWIVAEDSDRVKFFQKAGFRPVGVRRSLDTGVGDLVEHLWFAAL